MINDLGNYVVSFGGSSRRSVSSVLRQSLLEKEELGRLIEKTSSLTKASDYIPVMVSPLAEYQREVLVDLFRDLELRIKSLYTVSSTLSLLASGMENIFGGEIKKIEQDIEYLNSYIDNYSFISRRR